MVILRSTSILGGQKEGKGMMMCSNEQCSVKEEKKKKIGKEKERKWGMEQMLREGPSY